MACANYKKLCKNLIISQGITFTNNTLVINLPEGNYGDGCKYCIVVAQNIPATTTITSPVVFTIGADTTTTYPLLDCECAPVYACSINKRTRYSTIVHTNIGSGSFKLLGKIPCSSCGNKLASLPATEV
jgi:hypothetical protein